MVSPVSSTTADPSTTSSTTDNDQSTRNAADAATPTTKTNNNNKISLEEQLDRALNALYTNQQSTLKLFQAWRSQLFRLSLGVFVLVVIQAQKPAVACLQTIKEYNTNVDHETIPFHTAMMYVVDDSAMEVLCVICCVCLVWMLHISGSGSNGNNDTTFPNDFASTSYRLSCALIPGIMTLYYQHRMANNHSDDDHNDDGTTINNQPQQFLGQCLPSNMLHEIKTQQRQHDLTAEEPPLPNLVEIRSSFPVVLIFHLITSLALWFMMYQLKHHKTSIDKILKLKQELVVDEPSTGGGGGGGKGNNKNKHNNSKKNNSKKKR